MTAITRFDLKMDTDEREVISHAAALMGTTMEWLHSYAQQLKRKHVSY